MHVLILPASYPPVLDGLQTVAHTLVYQPFLSSRRLGAWRDRLQALPLLFAVGLAWEYGMLVQKLRQTGTIWSG